MSTDDEMIIEFDEATRSYYVIWRPMTAIGVGETVEEALEDVRQAAHLGIDTQIDMKQREIST